MSNQINITRIKVGHDNEMSSVSQNLKKYLIAEFNKFLTVPYFNEWISCHLEYNEQRRVNYIIENIKRYVSIEE